VDGRPVPAPVRFRLFFFHNARVSWRRAPDRIFYLPKLQGHLEARLWNDVFLYAQKELKPAAWKHRATSHRDAARRSGDGRDSVRAARTLGRAQFRRWDYIFSYIKTLRGDPGGSCRTEGR